MKKILVTLILCVSLVFTFSYVKTKAASSCSFLNYPYTVTGNSSISSNSALSTTSVTPYATVEVHATLVYLENPDSLLPTVHNWNKSDGRDGYAYVPFSISDIYRCYSIHGTHNLKNSSLYGYTDAYY